ncbi:hypothetical protein diail_8283, partial [Diaporthe ilicicola]
LIYDHNGGLIWAGGEAYAAEDNQGPHVYNFYPCDYSDPKTAKDGPHLCMNRGIQDVGTSRGEGLILGSDYQVVRGVHFNGTSPSIDIHEFTLVDNGTAAIMTQYRPMPADLSAYGIPGIGHVYDSIFQEQRLSDGVILFEWKSSDHIGLAESNVTFFGGTAQSPWDYFHINSIHKVGDGSGDYIVSARHTSTIYKISGIDGSIEWRLGGSHSDFKIASEVAYDSRIDGHGRWFHFQHDAKILQSEGETEIVSIFDNGRTPNQILDSPFSRGVVMKLDTSRRLATIEAEYFTEGRPQNSTLAGSMTRLPNGNTLVGWGKTGCLTEYDEEIRPVFEACLLDEGRPALYRAHKSSQWVGHPSGKPSILSYSKSGEKTAVYLSWNGATGIHSWRIFGSIEADSTHDRMWQEVLVGTKSGFETLLGPLPRFLPSVYAEALDSEGRVLGVTEATKTFIPSEVHDGCDDLWCNAMVMVDVEETHKTAIGIGLGSYSFLYPSVLLYVAVSFCLVFVTLGHCLRRRRLGLQYAKG